MHSVWLWPGATCRISLEVGPAAIPPDYRIPVFTTYSWSWQQGDGARLTWWGGMWKMRIFAFGTKPVRGQENYFKKQSHIGFLALSHIHRDSAGNAKTGCCGSAQATYSRKFRTLIVELHKSMSGYFRPEIIFFAKSKSKIWKKTTLDKTNSESSTLKLSKHAIEPKSRSPDR